MKRVHTHRGRFYQDENGKRYPSITTLLNGAIAKPALVAWSGKIERELCVEEAGRLYSREISMRESEEVLSELGFKMQLRDALGKSLASKKALEKAGDIGSNVHEIIEWKLKAELCHVNIGSCPEIKTPEAAIALNAWEDWRSKVNLKTKFVEHRIHSVELGIAATLDFVGAEINGIETLFDWKTGKRIYYEAHLQSAFLRFAVRERGLSDPKQGLLIRLPKTKDEPGFEVVQARPEEECIPVLRAVKILWDDMQKTDKWLKSQDNQPEEVEAA